MILLQANINGSVCNADNYSMLGLARDRLRKVKEDKLWARHEKNNQLRHKGTAYAGNVYNHILEETKELKDALVNNDFDNAIEEIADVVNCAEILAAILYANQES